MPTKLGEKSPIEHVVLIVRENKTYDTLLGDLGDKNANGDPSLRSRESITPNVHALARQFAHHDNFYDDSETSTQGHLWLSSSFVNDYMERTWLELQKPPGLLVDPTRPTASPRSARSSRTSWPRSRSPDYGEVTGVIGWPGVLAHVDTLPGTFFDLSVKDEKATYVAGQDRDQGAPAVVRLRALAGRPHERHVAGQPHAKWLIIATTTTRRAFSWTNSRIPSGGARRRSSSVKDDAEIGSDHVDYHRSICPRGEPLGEARNVSHVQTSLPSLFRTSSRSWGCPP